MFEIPSKGKLEVILGPVFSGKTTELIKRVNRYFLAGYKCIVISYSSQNKNGIGTIVSHDGNQIPALMVTNLQSDLQKCTTNVDVIGIDEGHQFIDITEFCKNASDNGKKIIVAAQDGNFERQGYLHVLNLVPLAEDVNKLTSICMSKSCRNDAPFTKKLLEKNSEEYQGVSSKYISTCQDCF